MLTLTLLLSAASFSNETPAKTDDLGSIAGKIVWEGEKPAAKPDFELKPEQMTGCKHHEGTINKKDETLLIDDKGERWAFVDALPTAPRMQWYRIAKRFMDQVKAMGCGSLKATPGHFETADRFLRRLGFEPTGEVRDGQRIYECRG